ncbi:hypothetical protein ACPA9J_07975 [Pseudomonas aeruginosa]
MQDDDFSLLRARCASGPFGRSSRTPAKPRKRPPATQAAPAQSSVRNDENPRPMAWSRPVRSSTSAPRTSAVRAQAIVVQESQSAQAQAGLVPFDGSLDLHGMSVRRPGRRYGTPRRGKPPAWKSAACA